MINRNNKKGFTIVELVIVIAVIAILAAVLIPTFAGVIRKANEAADTAVAKNMNTALATYSAENGTPESFEAVLVALEDAGYVLANLNAKANGNLYAWDKTNNQIVYIDADGEVIYQSTDFNQSDLKFVVANGSVALPEWADGTAVVDMTKPTGATFLKQTLVAGGSVELGSNITVTDESAKSANIVTDDTAINFGDKVLSLDLPNATSATANWIGLKIEEGDVVLDGTTGGVVTADNGELYAVALYNNYAEGSNVTIKGGKYIAGGHAVYIRIPNSTVTIEGGYFESTDSEYAINILDSLRGSSKFVVTGGTFVNFNPAESPCGEGEIELGAGCTVKEEVQENGDVWYTVVKG